jgi:hypothetical protein
VLQATLKKILFSSFVVNIVMFMTDSRASGNPDTPVLYFSLCTLLSLFSLPLREGQKGGGTNPSILL